MIRVCIVGGGLVSMQLSLALLKAGAATVEDLEPELPPDPHTLHFEALVARRPPNVEAEIIRAPTNGPQPNNRKGRRYDRHR